MVDCVILDVWLWLLVAVVRSGDLFLVDVVCVIGWWAVWYGLCDCFCWVCC